MVNGEVTFDHGACTQATPGEIASNAWTSAPFAPGAAGEVVVYAERHRKQLRVTVADNGVGLPVDFTLDASERLGLQIVRTLARGELRGTINLRTRPEGGTTAELLVPLARK